MLPSGCLDRIILPSCHLDLRSEVALWQDCFNFVTNVSILPFHFLPGQVDTDNLFTLKKVISY